MEKELKERDLLEVSPKEFNLAQTHESGGGLKVVQKVDEYECRKIEIQGQTLKSVHRPNSLRDKPVIAYCVQFVFPLEEYTQSEILRYVPSSLSEFDEIINLFETLPLKPSACVYGANKLIEFYTNKKGG